MSPVSERRASGGAFSAYGSDRSGVNVTAEWWDVPAARLLELSGRIRAALEAAGFEVRPLHGRLYIPPVAPPGRV
jgi:hypothetical protein